MRCPILYYSKLFFAEQLYSLSKKNSENTFDCKIKQKFVYNGFYIAAKMNLNSNHRCF